MKFRRPSDISIIFVFNLLGFHVMWYDSHDNLIRHFTHKRLHGFHCDLFFRGYVETLTLGEFGMYCRSSKRRMFSLSQWRK